MADRLEEAEAHLVSAKRLRRNARIALSHHTRTMETALAEEGTTAVELEELITRYNRRHDSLEEAPRANHATNSR